VNQPAHEEEALGKVYDLRLLRRLWRIVAPYRWQVILTLALVAPTYLLELAPAWIVKTGLDSVVLPPGAGEPSAEVADPGVLNGLFEAPGGIPELAWLGALYLLVTVTGAALHFLNGVLMATTGQAAMRDLRQQVFRHVQRLHMGFFDRYPVGRLVTRLSNDVENVAEMFSAGIVAFVTDLVKMVGFAAALFLVNAKLALVALIIVPVLALAAAFFRYKVRDSYRTVRVRIARINAHLQETITGMKVVQLFIREQRNLRDFDAMNASHRDAWFHAIRYDALLFATVEAASGITVALIIWRGTGLAEPGVLYVFIDWMRRFFMPLRDLSAKYSVMQSSMAGCERVFQLLDTEPAITDPGQGRSRALSRRDSVAGPGLGAVEFQNVWFAYQGEDWVLRDVSFRVEPGQRVAFVGATGAGKTTVAKLLNRLYEVGQGRVLVDGVDVRELSKADLSERIATVLQDVYLFSGTVADNISLGRESVDEAAVIRAARTVEANRFVERLPEGYATEVRERGSNFSAGQRQLLSFARALAQTAEILVLDEATSSIDTETETLVQRGIHLLMQGRTALVIAHRLSTIQHVDHIYVMHRGRIVESGRHDELLALRGVYYRLYRLQHQAQATAEGRWVAAGE
jgi:ATP-binding cassette subfamily B protein